MKSPSADRPLRILKFGGTSVKSAARIHHVCKLIAEQSVTHHLVVVVSAMGDTTDYLIRLAHHASLQPDSRELDHLLATGEQISVALVAMSLLDHGIAAQSFTAGQVGIFTESVHNKARIVDIDTKNIFSAISKGRVAVVAGFQGITKNGDVTTLGRGGSDTTAVALSAAMSADECDIFTDVDGIFTADPAVVKTARLLAGISYDEGLELARLGTHVIHPRAVDLSRQYKIRLHIRNTFKPDCPGTVIGENQMEIFRAVSGVAVQKDEARVAILEVPDKPGTAAKIMQKIADRHIVVDMIMQSFHPLNGLNSITFTVPERELPEVLSTLNQVKEELGAREVLSEAGIAKVSLIGSGLAGNPDIAARLFLVFAKAGINIKMISTSEMRITCVVDEKEADKAANLIHGTFLENSHDTDANRADNSHPGLHSSFPL